MKFTKVLFIGQNPSVFNIDNNVAFIGSKSYTRLQTWIEKLGLEISDVGLINASKKLGLVNMRDADFRSIYLALLGNNNVKIVCLGRYAERVYKKLQKEGIVTNPFFMLPHPSGLNRTLNDSNFVERKLAECKKFLSNQ